MLRFIVQSLETGEFLEWNLPLNKPEIQFTLSGPGHITGELAPEFPDEQKTMLSEWGTLLHAEVDGVIRASGIILPSDVDDVTLKIDAEGASGYPHGIPYLGEYSQLNIDPLDVVREIWSHLKSFPNGPSVLQIADTKSPVRIGTELDYDKKPKPYTLSWWDNKDCGDEIDTLAKSTPFDYAERSWWNDDKSQVLHKIEIGYPRLGGRRFDLRFAQDENITKLVPVKGTDVYASDVTVIGSGEGKDAIRGSASVPVPGRLRRVATIVDKAVTTADSATALAKDELRRRQASLLSVDEITVAADHPNAPFGSFVAGDDIRIQARVPWIGEIALWHRITAFTFKPDDNRVVLKLKRSDLFRYGRDDVTPYDAWILDDPVLSILDQTTILG